MTDLQMEFERKIFPDLKKGIREAFEESESLFLENSLKTPVLLRNFTDIIRKIKELEDFTKNQQLHG